ncbi:UPF0149 family protein [Thiolapillus sp.]
MNDFTPDYRYFADCVEAAGLDYSAAEVHGILAGMLCGRVADWRKMLLEETNPEDPQVQTCTTAIENLLLFSAEELRNGQIPLHLMLPDEQSSIAERASAIRDWSQGFLFGFGLAGEQKQNLLNSDAGEALQDFAEIARMNLEDFGEHQEAEEALMQLEEYLWVATSLIWHEARSDDQD